MLLPHAITLAQARSYLAALADQAPTLEASAAYERTLIDLDRLHGDESPALTTDGLTHDREILYATASSAIEALTAHGVDALGVELILAMLEDAHGLDVP